MSHLSSFVETEIKLRLTSAQVGRENLERLGFQVAKPRNIEANVIYDTPDLALRSTKRILRLRNAGGQYLITFKGPASRGKHKSRQEIETTLGDIKSIEAILHELGYEPVFRYEKFRTEYIRSGHKLVVTLDETPIGCFFELEGEGTAIDQVAQELGFSETDYILASYGALYREHCTRIGCEPTHMTFP